MLRREKTADKRIANSADKAYTAPVAAPTGPPSPSMTDAADPLGDAPTPQRDDESALEADRDHHDSADDDTGDAAGGGTADTASGGAPQP